MSNKIKRYCLLSQCVFFWFEGSAPLLYIRTHYQAVTIFLQSDMRSLPQLWWEGLSAYHASAAGSIVSACITSHHNPCAFSLGFQQTSSPQGRGAGIGMLHGPNPGIPTLSLDDFRQVRLSFSQALSSSSSLVCWCHGQVIHLSQQWRGRGMVGWGNIQTSDLGTLF